MNGVYFSFMNLNMMHKQCVAKIVCGVTCIMLRHANAKPNFVGFESERRVTVGAHHVIWSSRPNGTPQPKLISNEFYTPNLKTSSRPTCRCDTHNSGKFDLDFNDVG